MFLDYLLFYGILGVLILFFLIFKIFKLLYLSKDNCLGKALFLAFILYLSYALFHNVRLAEKEMAPFFLLLGLLENNNRNIYVST